jgi:hypothetical protein
MSKPIKTKRDLLAAMEDDVRQFRDALFKALRAQSPVRSPSAWSRSLGRSNRLRFPPRRRTEQCAPRFESRRVTLPGPLILLAVACMSRIGGLIMTSVVQHRCNS